jgi:rsbT co-antagonist protein RsbR
VKKETEALLAVLTEESASIVKEWVAAMRIGDAAFERSVTDEATQIVRSLADTLKAGADPERMEGPQWADLKGMLTALSRSRAAQGQSAGETSNFVLAMKKPLFRALQRRLEADPPQVLAGIGLVTTIGDSLAQQTASAHQVGREDIIRRQQNELLELSTPVIKLWEGVLAVPMIGTLDSSRTQMVMEALLQRIVETEATIAIIDITGVPTVDTLVAQHLLKTVSAIRLMGADCIISGIRPQIAQTIVHLGIELQGISTKSTLADALSLALQRTGFRVVREAT